MATDLLRCNPKFHGAPRYDGVQYKTTDSSVGFGRLVLIFTCIVGKWEMPIALIQPYDVISSEKWKEKDEDLGFFRLRGKPRDKSEFIPLDSIIRGALLVEDYEEPGDYLVVDVIGEGEMFLRINKLRSTN